MSSAAKERRTGRDHDGTEDGAADAAECNTAEGEHWVREFAESGVDGHFKFLTMKTAINEQERKN